jgi:hypothetical protein
VPLYTTSSTTNMGATLDDGIWPTSSSAWNGTAVRRAPRLRLPPRLVA